MNTEKKLEYFTQAIAKEVETKKRQARRQMAAEFNDAVSRAVSHAEAEAQVQISAERQTIQSAGNRRITEANTQARRALATLRERLTVQLFEDIKTDIVSFVHSHEYESFLLDSIRDALAQSKYDFTYVQLTPHDMRLSTAIQEATGLTPEPGEESDIGGFRLLTENRSIANDFTIQSRLASAIEEFSAELS